MIWKYVKLEKTPDINELDFKKELKILQQYTNNNIIELLKIILTVELEKIKFENP